MISEEDGGLEAVMRQTMESCWRRTRSTTAVTHRRLNAGTDPPTIVPHFKSRIDGLEFMIVDRSS